MVWKGNPFKKARAEELGCMTQSENEAFWRDYKLGRKQRTQRSSGMNWQQQNQIWSNESQIRRNEFNNWHRNEFGY